MADKVTLIYEFSAILIDEADFNTANSVEESGIGFWSSLEHFRQALGSGTVAAIIGPDDGGYRCAGFVAAAFELNPPGPERVAHGIMRLSLDGSLLGWRVEAQDQQTAFGGRRVCAFQVGDIVCDLNYQGGIGIIASMPLHPEEVESFSGKETLTGDDDVYLVLFSGGDHGHVKEFDLFRCNDRINTELRTELRQRLKESEQ